MICLWPFHGPTCPEPIFGKSSSWLYHKMDGRDGNGKPTSFTPEEAEKLKGALLDLSDRIRRAADTI